MAQGGVRRCPGDRGGRRVVRRADQLAHQPLDRAAQQNPKCARIRGEQPSTLVVLIWPSARDAATAGLAVGTTSRTVAQATAPRQPAIASSRASITRRFATPHHPVEVGRAAARGCPPALAMA
jgi:hypothetical protein